MARGAASDSSNVVIPCDAVKARSSQCLESSVQSSEKHSLEGALLPLELVEGGALLAVLSLPAGVC